MKASDSLLFVLLFLVFPLLPFTHCGTTSPYGAEFRVRFPRLRAPIILARLATMCPQQSRNLSKRVLGHVRRGATKKGTHS